MVKQGAVSLNGEKIADENYQVAADKEYLIKVGKRKFVKALVNA